MSEEKRKRVLTQAQIDGLAKGREKAKANALLRKEKMKRLEELESKDEIQEYPTKKVPEVLEKKTKKKVKIVEEVVDESDDECEADPEPILKPKRKQKLKEEIQEVKPSKTNKQLELQKKREALEQLRLEKEYELENERIELEMQQIRNKKLVVDTPKQQESAPQPYFRFR